MSGLHTRFLVVIIALAACNNEALDPGGGTPPTGIYRVTTSLSENDCSLQPQSLSDTYPLIVDGEHMNLPQPGGLPGSLLRIDVPGDSISLDTSPCGAQLSSLIEVLYRDDRMIRVRTTYDWTSVASDGNPLCSIPATRCRAVQQFDFELQEKCEAPCTFAGDPLGNVRCVCD